MPLYFGTIAPTCPISQDQPVAGRPYPIRVRTTFPRPTDLESAIIAANILRSIVTSITQDRVINNVFNPNVPTGGGVAKNIDKTKKPRWTEQKDKRVFRNYKYYAKTQDGKDDKSMWVVMQRIEQMVWYDSAWKSALKWTYGNKGEGKPVGGPTGPGVSGED
jgi:hypothetical protein